MYQSTLTLSMSATIVCDCPISNSKIIHHPWCEVQPPRIDGTLCSHCQCLIEASSCPCSRGEPWADGKALSSEHLSCWICGQKGHSSRTCEKNRPSK